MNIHYFLFDFKQKKKENGISKEDYENANKGWVQILNVTNDLAKIAFG